MAKVFNIFSTEEGSPKDFSIESANQLIPLVKKYTEEAMRETQKVGMKLEYLQKGSPQFKALSSAHDQVIIRWAERIHRIGGLAKGLWTVDFDNGQGYLCWNFPEDKIEHFHTYEEGFKQRKKLSEVAQSVSAQTADSQLELGTKKKSKSQPVPKKPSAPETQPTA